MSEPEQNDFQRLRAGLVGAQASIAKVEGELETELARRIVADVIDMIEGVKLTAKALLHEKR
jgi:hypothetical protein